LYHAKKNKPTFTMKLFYYSSLIFMMLSLFGEKDIQAQVLTPPSCVITYPHNNAYYQEGSNLLIRVYSTGMGGTGTNSPIDKVEFFVDDIKVHETSAHSFGTYTFLWEDLEAGTYRITASATNEQSVDFTSAGVFVTVGANPVVKRGLSSDKGKYLGNIVGYGARGDFLTYWNGVTSENGSKWGVVESTQDVMNWYNSDVAYYLAENNHLSYRYHAIAWGSQYPSWIEALSSDVPAFRAEMEEYMAAIAERYPYIDQLDVLNENLRLNTYNGREHAAGTPYFRSGLGGSGVTGYDWVIWLFEKAREYFPNSKLVMNDFELETNPSGIYEMLAVIKVLRDRGLIDGFGTQAHSFNVDAMATQPDVLKQRIDLMASSGVPVYATELDLTGISNDEASQLFSYQNTFPVFWEHPAVAGITLWGYVEGSTWQTGTGLLNSNGSKRSAMVWLEDYLSNRPNVGYPHSVDGVPSHHEDIQAPSEKKWIVSPNPFDNQLRVECQIPGISTVSYKIYSISGELASQGVVNGQGLIASNHLKAGFYFLLLDSGSAMETIKLFKQ
jgi:GH35 family endo-1,4-beta-xylanase